MKVHQIYTGSDLKNFSYLIEIKKGELLCVDPFDADQIINYARNLKSGVIAIINTHEHWDHVLGNEKLSAVTGAEIWAHENAKGKIPHVNRFLTKGERIDFEGGYLEVLDTPGHTFAHLCLLLVEGDKPKAIFSGDTFMNAGVGHCHSGDMAILYKTIIEQFKNLPDEVLVYPGHEYYENNLNFTLNREPNNTKAKELLAMIKNLEPLKKGDGYYINNMNSEREVNTFLRLDSQEICANLNHPQTEKDVFIELRKLRDKW